MPPHVLDEFHEVERQVLEALDRGDALHEEADGDGQPHVENEEDVDIVDELDGFVQGGHHSIVSRFKNERCVGDNHHHEHVLGVPCEQYIHG